MGERDGRGVVGLSAHVTGEVGEEVEAFLVLSDPEHVYAAMDKIVHKHLETLC